MTARGLIQDIIHHQALSNRGEEMTNYLMDRIKNLKSNRKVIRQQKQSAQDQALKTELDNQIDDNILAQKQAEIERINQMKQEKKQKENAIKEELKERFYYLANKTYQTFRKIGLLESKRELSSLLDKHPTYLTSIEINRRLPAIETLDTLRAYLNEIIDSFDFFMTDEEIINKENIKKILKNLYENFEELKQDMLIKIYKLWG